MRTDYSSDALTQRKSVGLQHLKPEASTCDTPLKLIATSPRLIHADLKKRLPSNPGGQDDTNRQRRSKLELYACIIKRVSVQAFSATRITQIENLSYRLTCEYLAKMLNYGLIEQIDDKDRVAYLATKKGMQYVASLENAMKNLANDRTSAGINGP